MSFLDDLLRFGSGALETVGENLGGILGHYIPGMNNTANPGATQQRDQGVADNYGNRVTVGQGAVGAGATPAQGNQMMWLAGGLGAVLLMILLVVLVKK